MHRVGNTKAKQNEGLTKLDQTTNGDKKRQRTPKNCFGVFRQEPGNETECLVISIPIDRSNKKRSLWEAKSAADTIKQEYPESTITVRNRHDTSIYLAEGKPKVEIEFDPEGDLQIYAPQNPTNLTFLGCLSSRKKSSVSVLEAIKKQRPAGETILVIPIPIPKIGNTGVTTSI